jgi:hypothetical protein
LPGVLASVFAEGVLVGFAVKKARDWKHVLTVFALARCLSSLGVVTSVAIATGIWDNFGSAIAQLLIGGIPLTLILLPLALNWLAEPVRRALGCIGAIVHGRCDWA